MHGFTNFEQSKALFEHGYRHPFPIEHEFIGLDSDSHQEILQDYPCFSLADLVTAYGAMALFTSSHSPMPEIIECYVDRLIKFSYISVHQSNQRLNQAYAN
jgi:hypothetical protein